jgi:hypothetical protein
MKLSQILLAATFSLSLVAAGACGTSTSSPNRSLLGAGGDWNGTTTSGSSTSGTTSSSTSTSSGNTTSSSTSSGNTTSSSTSSGNTTSSSSSGGTCKLGGTACVAFNECCSGTCANQHCTQCSAPGQACGVGCCLGLTCYQNLCNACVGDGSSCLNASDCCSNVCQQGTCQAPAPCTTCNQYLLQAGNPANICAASQQAFAALEACACNAGPCASACASNACLGMAASPDCTSCVQSACGAQVQFCLSN